MTIEIPELEYSCGFGSGGGRPGLPGTMCTAEVLSISRTRAARRASASTATACTHSPT